jgi:cytochrome oxidase assembly protein ShyY1
MDRLAWKTAWLAQIEAAYQSPGLVMPNDTIIDRTFFTRGTVTVRFDPKRIFIVKPRLHHRTFGGHMYQWAGPFPDGKYYWVNRGFVTDTGTIKPPINGAPVMVQLRVPDLNWADLQRKYPILVDDPAPKIVAITEPQGINESYPIAIGTRPTPPNDHFQYALFWFFMSGVAGLMGIFLIAQRKRA